MAKPRSALLVIDMINTFDFVDGRTLARMALPVSKRVAALRSRFHEKGAPVIFVNDNFMDWKADFKELVAVCSHPASIGAEIAERLRPSPDDYFVLKPKHSAFQHTPLSILLAKLEVGRVVLTGIAADSCILATGHDANMREIAVHVPRDCVAAVTSVRKDRALQTMKDAFGADIRSSRTVVP